MSAFTSDFILVTEKDNTQRHCKAFKDVIITEDDVVENIQCLLKHFIKNMTC